MKKIYVFLWLVLSFYISVKGQEFWTPAGTLAGNDYVPAIEWSTSGTVLAYSHSHGIYRSTNDGDTWTMTGISNQNVSAIKTAPDGNIYAVCNTTSALYIQRSTDDGFTWNIVYTSSRPNNFFAGGGITFCGTDTILAVIAFTIGPTLGDIASEIVRSVDGGSNFQLLNTAYTWSASDLIRLPDGRIIVSAGLNRILYSTDNGTTWNGFPGFPIVYPTFIANDSHGNIYTGLSTAATQVNLLYRSTDNGVSWQGLDLYSGSSGEVRAIYVDHQDRVYVSINTFSPDAYNVYRSDDGGDTWETMNSGLPVSQLVRSLTGNSGDVIFAGTGSGGVYRGANVTPVNLASFTAAADDNIVILNWSTASETNNKAFEIERSTGYEWQKIGSVEGAGTTTEPRSYSFTDQNASEGQNFYRLKQIDFNGQSQYSEEIQVDVNSPALLSLSQNYPNPLNPSTVISYKIGEKNRVSLKVYDALGKETASLVDEEQAAGRYSARFDASGLSSGTYIYRLKAGSFTRTGKMIFMK